MSRSGMEGPPGEDSRRPTVNSGSNAAWIPYPWPARSSMASLRNVRAEGFHARPPAPPALASPQRCRAGRLAPDDPAVVGVKEADQADLLLTRPRHHRVDHCVCHGLWVARPPRLRTAVANMPGQPGTPGAGNRVFSGHELIVGTS